MNSISNRPPAEDGPCGVGEKACRRCGKCYPETPEYFSRDQKGRNGLHYQCKNCSQAQSRKYKQANREKVHAYNRQWVKDNWEHMQEYKRQYREEHKDEIADYKRQYREDNREAIIEARRLYEAENPEKALLRNHRNRSNRHNASGTFTAEYLLFLMDLQAGRCCWCGQAMENTLTIPNVPRREKFTIEHIRPLNRNGTNWHWNIALACQACNGSHYDKLVFLERDPPAMLSWMLDYIVRAAIFDLTWHLLMWKIKLHR